MVDLILDRANFDVNINVSVFETNIRIIGGLLSGHLMSRKCVMKLLYFCLCSSVIDIIFEIIDHSILSTVSELKNP